jgi:hypothetical protein
MLALAEERAIKQFESTHGPMCIQMQNAIVNGQPMPRPSARSAPCNLGIQIYRVQQNLPHPVSSMIPRNGQSSVRFLCAGTSSGLSDAKTTGSIRLDINADGSHQ